MKTTTRDSVSILPKTACQAVRKLHELTDEYPDRFFTSHDTDRTWINLYPENPYDLCSVASCRLTDAVGAQAIYAALADYILGYDDTDRYSADTITHWIDTRNRDWLVDGWFDSVNRRKFGYSLFLDETGSELFRD
jgi:hypothetical protein